MMIYYAYLSNKIQEGGMARNKAFYDYYLSKATVINQFSSFKLIRIFKAFSTLVHWLFLKNQKILIHQGTFLYMFPDVLLKFRFFRIICFNIFKHLAKRNFMYLEVNDLRYEQAIDLELKADIKLILVIQKSFFEVNKLNYIFASKGLKDYAVLKYGIMDQVCQVAINGGFPSDSTLSLEDNAKFGLDIINVDHFNFVYAGSLNKGRQIEKLISIFKVCLNCNLILLGTGGEWINNYIKSNSNIHYLGNHDERVAQKIVAKCDVGIIPYDSKRLYYNICYPTKASFYVTSGLGILSTPLTTLMDMFLGKGFIEFKDYDEWEEFLKNLTHEQVSALKNNALNFQADLYWNNVLKEVKFDSQH